MENEGLKKELEILNIDIRYAEAKANRVSAERYNQQDYRGQN